MSTATESPSAANEKTPAEAPLTAAPRDKAPRVKALMAEIAKEKAAILEALRPHREFHDQHVNDPRFLEARRAIKAASATLGALDNEMAALARALPGNKGIKVEPGVFEAQ